LEMSEMSKIKYSHFRAIRLLILRWATVNFSAKSGLPKFLDNRSVVFFKVMSS